MSRWKLSKHFFNHHQSKISSAWASYMKKRSSAPWHPSTLWFCRYVDFRTFRRLGRCSMRNWRSGSSQVSWGQSNLRNLEKHQEPHLKKGEKRKKKRHPEGSAPLGIISYQGFFSTGNPKTPPIARPLVDPIYVEWTIFFQGLGPPNFHSPFATPMPVTLRQTNIAGKWTRIEDVFPI